MTVGVLEAVLRVRDEMTGTLQRAGGVVRAHANDFAGLERSMSKSVATGTFLGNALLGVAQSLGSMAFGAVSQSIVGMNSSLETSEQKFATLMGSAEQAKAHVAGLFEFAKKTPFETGPVIAASVKMQTFGGAALNTKENLTLLGDASAAVGAPIEELGFWVGRLYSQVKGGQPFGEAAMRLQELAVMTPETRKAMEGLGKSAADNTKKWEIFQAQLGSFSGAMVKQAGTWVGVTSTLTDVVNLTIAGAMRPLFEDMRNAIQGFNNWLEANSATLTRWGLHVQAAYQQVKDVAQRDVWPVLQRIGVALYEVWVAAQPAIKALARVMWDVLVVALKGLVAAFDTVVAIVKTAKDWFDGLPGPVKTLATDLGLLAIAVWAVHAAMVALTGTTVIAGVTSLAGSLSGLIKLAQLMGTIPALQLFFANIMASSGATAVLNGVGAALGTVTGLFATGATAGALYMDTMAGAITNGKGLKSLQDDIASVLGGRTTPAIREADAALVDLSHSAAENEAAWTAQALAARDAAAGTESFSVATNAATVAAIQNRAPIEASAEALKKFAAAQKQMSGQATIDAANEGIKAYEALSKKGIIPTTEAQQQLHEQVEKAIKVYEDRFEAVPEKLKGMQVATEGLLASTQLGLSQLTVPPFGDLMHAEYIRAADGLLASTNVVEEGFVNVRLGAETYRDALGVLVPVIDGVHDAQGELLGVFDGSGKGLRKIGEDAKTFTSQIKDNIPKVTDVLDTMSRAAEMSGHKTSAALLSAGSTIAKAFASGGPWGAAIAGVGLAMTALWNKFGKGEQKKINDTRDAFISAAGGLAQLNAKAVAAGTNLTALLNAKNAKDYEAAVAALNTRLEETAKIQGEIAGLQQQLADRQVMDWQAAEELITKYGGTLGNLGEQFVAAKEASSWKEVWDDWQTLIDMGADVGGVLVSMKDEIGQLVQNATKFGTEIPAQFKPLIEELMRSGQLLDENGDAITDMAGMKFGGPLVSEVDKIIAAIKELVAALSGPNGVTKAIDGIPRDVPVNVRYTYKDYEPPEFDAPEGSVDGGPGFASGTGGRYLNFGAGTAVMLHGKERVMTEAEGRQGGGAPVIITVISQLDGREVARNQVRHLPSQLALAGL